MLLRDRVEQWKAQLDQQKAEIREEGLEEGRIEALREALLSVLEARFAIPPAVAQRLLALDDEGRLKALMTSAATAASLESFLEGLHAD